jgi:mono/diheme cytochrome c family protein
LLNTLAPFLNLKTRAAFTMDTFTRIFSKLLVSALLTTLFACGGGPIFDSGSSSSLSNTSSGEVSSSGANSSVIQTEITGGQLYAQQCAKCHGDKGQGAGAGGQLKTCSVCSNTQLLIETIDETMPLGKPEQCDLDCSTKIAAFIQNDFKDIGGGVPPKSSANSTNSKVSSVSVSSKPANVSSVVNNTSSESNARSSVGYIGNVARGESYYNGLEDAETFADGTRIVVRCVGCHGANGTSTSLRIDPSKATYAHSTDINNPVSLAIFIEKYMPKTDRNGNKACVGQCAYDLEAYIRSWVPSNNSSIGASSKAPSSAAASSKPNTVSSKPNTASSVKPSSIAASSIPNVASSVMTRSSSAASVVSGQALFASKCSDCHTVDGLDLTNPSYVATNLSLDNYIDEYMPIGNPDDCDLNCSIAIANYIRSFGASSSKASSVVASSIASSVAKSSKPASSVAVVSSSKANSSTAVNSSSKPNSSVKASSSSSVSGGVIFQESFESTAVGAQPAGWNNLIAYVYNGSNTISGSNYALVDNSKSFNGTNSIHFKGNFAQIVRALPANTQRVHLRAWVNSNRQIGNIPGDDSTSNHSHIMGIKKTTDANNEVRVGEIKGVLGTNQVPSDDIAPRADKWRKGPQISANTWECVEVAMYGDTAYDELYMWVNGALVHSITSSADWQNNPQPADWLSDKFNYVEFGFQSYTGQQTADVWMDDLVVSTAPIGCGAVTTSSTPASSSTPSVSSSATSSSGTTVGNAVSGKALYEAKCMNCHGAKGDGRTRLDPTKSVYKFRTNPEQNLVEYISAWMPLGSQTLCNGQCGQDVAAYIRTWVATSSSASSTGGVTTSSRSSSSAGTPPSNCGVAYGARSMRLLTKNEYNSTVRDLTGIDLIKDLGQSTFDALPADSLINGFSNNVLASIESGSLQSYNLVATKVVDLLASRSFAGVIDCTGLTGAECHIRFVDGIGLKIFRRPLTTDERAAYAPLFTTEFSAGDNKESIKLALRTMFTSPQFLYRSEVGVSVADLNAGVGGGDAKYEATGTVQTLTPKTVPLYQRADGNVNFTGNDLIEIIVKGALSPLGLWSTLNIDIDQTNQFSLLVNHTDERKYQFHVTNQTGNKYMALINQQTGNDQGARDLGISSIKVSGAKLVTPAAPPVNLDADAYVLTPYELASFLSYTFAGTTPDAALLTAAGSDQLATDAQIQAQVQRLLLTASAKQHFGNFAAQWLRTDKVLTIAKDNALYPGFTPNVRKAMAQEVRDVFNHVVLEEGEAFTKLFDGNFTFVNQDLANFYKIGGVTGSNMRKVSNVASRAGLVTSGAFLSVNAHDQETGPILRAVYARRGFMCHDVPPPPTGVKLDGVREEQRLAWEAYLAANGGKAASRKKYEFLTASTDCEGCHKEMINPLGGGFEDFDAVGLPQTADYNGLTIDASGVLHGITSPNDAQSVSFNGAKDIAHHIAGFDSTRQCFIDNSFRLAMGTGSDYFDHEKAGIQLSAAEKTSYSCEVKKLDNVMKTSNNSTVALLKALGSLESVRYRKNVTR